MFRTSQGGCPWVPGVVLGVLLWISSGSGCLLGVLLWVAVGSSCGLGCPVLSAPWSQLSFGYSIVGALGFRLCFEMSCSGCPWVPVVFWDVLFWVPLGSGCVVGCPIVGALGFRLCFRMSLCGSSLVQVVSWCPIVVVPEFWLPFGYLLVPVMFWVGDSHVPGEWRAVSMFTSQPWGCDEGSVLK